MDSIHIGYSSSVSQYNNFYLHSHNNYEILFFLSGDVDYIVEGAVYPLKQNDMIIVRPGEMHRAYLKSDSRYNRVIINIDEDFFRIFECEQYKSVFVDRAAGTKNLISAENIRAYGIDELFSRLDKYSDNYRDFSSPVTSGIMLELLHILNSVRITESRHPDRLQKVIAYINENFDSDITLASIAEVFFVSKPHLSREFRRRTGYTVSDYVNRKRIESVRTLYQNGFSLGNACADSGFNDYSAFYRAVRKAYGTSPREWLENTSKHYKLY